MEPPHSPTEKSAAYRRQLPEGTFSVPPNRRKAATARYFVEQNLQAKDCLAERGFEPAEILPGIHQACALKPRADFV
jgi:hypothetical protein